MRRLNHAVSGTGASCRRTGARGPRQADEALGVGVVGPRLGVDRVRVRRPRAGACLATSANRPVSLSLRGNCGRGLAASGFGEQVNAAGLVVVEEVQLAVVVLAEGDDVRSGLSDLRARLTRPSPSKRVPQSLRVTQSPQM